MQSDQDTWKPRPIRLYRIGKKFYIYVNGKKKRIDIPPEYSANLRTAQAYIMHKLQARPMSKNREVSENYTASQLRAMAEGRDLTQQSRQNINLENSLKLDRLLKAREEIRNKPDEIARRATELGDKLDALPEDDPNLPAIKAELAAIPMALLEAKKAFDQITTAIKDIPIQDTPEEYTIKPVLDEPFTIGPPIDVDSMLQSITASREQRAAARLAKVKEDLDKQLIEEAKQKPYRKKPPMLQPGKVKVKPRQPENRKPKRSPMDQSEHEHKEPIQEGNAQRPMDQRQTYSILDTITNIQQIGKGVSSNTTKANERPALWSDQIEDYFKNEPRFAGVYAVDEMKYLKKLPLPFGFIVNMSKSNEPGSHWCSVYITPDSIEYYDPTGHDPPKQLIKDLHAKLTSWHIPIMLKLKINKVANQNNASNHCGYFAIRFLDERMNGTPFAAATKFLDPNNIKPTTKQNGEAVINAEFKLM